MIAKYLSAIWAAIAPALADHLWQSTLFAVTVGVLTLALRRNHARARYGLWMAASVKFLIPFSLLVNIGSRLAWSRGSTGTNAGFYVVMEEVSQPFTQPMISMISRSPSPSSLASPALTHLLPALLSAAWICGFAAVILAWYARWRRISVAMRAAAPLREGRELDALRRLERSANMRQGIRMLISRASLEPGIFGILRPVLVWPEGISEHLEDAHLEAILAHEVWHLRRRDNLAAAVHMVVEAVFWFHPLVWWLGARLLEERERACDERVLELGSERQIYAESILKVCEFCLGSPLACVSGVTGADLQKRMVYIMSERSVRKLNFGKKLLLSAAALVAVGVPIILGLMTATQSRAQSQDEGTAKVPTFATASLKPDKSSDRVGLMFTPNGMTATNVPLQMLLREAYKVEDDRISGAPSWVKSEKYDLQAKVDTDHTDQPQEPSIERYQLMLQSLLAERFKLKLHWETKNLPVFELVVAKDGFKLHESKTDPPGSPSPHAFRVTSKGQLAAQGVPVSLLVRLLSEQVGHTVVDKTGLAGSYEFTLQWKPDDSAASQTPTFGGAQGTAGTASGPSIFTAIQEQLGLELEPHEVPMEVLVIDHVEKPVEN